MPPPTGWRWKTARHLHHHLGDEVPHRAHMVNLLDTPATKTLEDTYRTLTAVDSALMVLDGGQGVMEPHHCPDGSLPPAGHADRQLHQQARPRYPRPIGCSTRSRRCWEDQGRPITWPIGCYREFLAFITWPTTRSSLHPGPAAMSAPEQKVIDKLDSDEAASTWATSTSASSMNWNWSRAPAEIRSGRLPSRAK